MLWALLAVVAILVIAIFTGKFIHVGMSDDEEEDYMIGDDESDWGDKP